MTGSFPELGLTRLTDGPWPGPHSSPERSANDRLQTGDPSPGGLKAAHPGPGHCGLSCRGQDSMPQLVPDSIFGLLTAWAGLGCFSPGCGQFFLCSESRLETLGLVLSLSEPRLLLFPERVRSGPWPSLLCFWNNHLSTVGLGRGCVELPLGAPSPDAQRLAGSPVPGASRPACADSLLWPSPRCRGWQATTSQGLNCFDL